MDSKKISEIFQVFTHCTPQKIERCAVGIGNQVYIVTCDNIKYVFRCSTEDLNFIEGKDIGLVYSGLTKSEKRKIARDVIDMQNKVAQLPL